jgi:RNA polymerase sigma-70 factor (ECF subfamily)
MNLQQTHARFGTTSWTLVGALRDENDQQQEAARDLVITLYWPPVYASLRRMGHNRERAAELTQAFFVEVVIGRGLLDQADAARGRLRSLLLTALKRFAIDQHRRQCARPDGDGLSLENLEREEGFLAREPARDADEVFERRWAVAVLEEALVRCERSCREAGLEKHWAAFEAFIVQPSIGAVEPPSLSRLADELGFASATHVASAMKVVRKRMKLLLREVVAETADDDPADQQAEYDRIIAMLR